MIKGGSDDSQRLLVRDKKDIFIKLMEKDILT